MEAGAEPVGVRSSKPCATKRDARQGIVMWNLLIDRGRLLENI
jgi:hypothetical protein